jgi:hypothetical protein
MAQAARAAAPPPPPPRPQGVRPDPNPTPTGATVIIGCKLPHGIFLHLDSREEVVGLKGGIETKFVREEGSERLINGANTSRLVGGFGLTTLEKDWWDAWIAQNTNKRGKITFKPYATGMIFAVNSQSEAIAESRQREGLRTGFEPVNPAKPGPGLEPVEGNPMTSGPPA